MGKKRKKSVPVTHRKDEDDKVTLTVDDRLKVRGEMPPPQKRHHNRSHAVRKGRRRHPKHKSPRGNLGDFHILNFKSDLKQELHLRYKTPVLSPR